MAKRPQSSGTGSEQDPLFFETVEGFRTWLSKNHQRRSEAWVGMYRVASGKPSITWSEVVDVCLCFGWIDGIRKTIDGTSYMNRVTPRKTGSNWSLKNITRVHELIEAGLMTPDGLAAFEARRPDREGVYSFESGEATLPPEYESELRANASAAAFFDALAPGYRRRSVHWVMSAKQEATRRRRLQALIEDSANGQRIALLRG